MRAHGDAEAVSIEEASVRAFKTDLFGPSFAEEVAFRNNACIGVGDTVSILDNRSVVAG